MEYTKSTNYCYNEEQVQSAMEPRDLIQQGTTDRKPTNDQRHIARGGHELPKVLLGHAMPYPSMTCGRFRGGRL
jgi:hypothetical protein